MLPRSLHLSCANQTILPIYKFSSECTMICTPLNKVCSSNRCFLSSQNRLTSFQWNKKSLCIKKAKKKRTVYKRDYVFYAVYLLSCLSHENFLTAMKCTSQSSIRNLISTDVKAIIALENVIFFQKVTNYEFFFQNSSRACWRFYFCL